MNWVRGNAPDKRFGVEIRALVRKIQTGQRIQIVGALHVAQREGTREVGHGHCIEGGFHIECGRTRADLQPRDKFEQEDSGGRRSARSKDFVVNVRLFCDC